MRDVKEILDILKRYVPEGKENAIHTNELAERIGVNSSDVKKYVQAVRQKIPFNGWFICSGHEGYWWTKDRAEIEACCKMLFNPAITRLRTSKQFRQRLKECDEQISMTDNGIWKK